MLQIMCWTVCLQFASTAVRKQHRWLQIPFSAKFQGVSGFILINLFTYIHCPHLLLIDDT